MRQLDSPPISDVPRYIIMLRELKEGQHHPDLFTNFCLDFIACVDYDHYKDYMSWSEIDLIEFTEKIEELRVVFDRHFA